MAISDQEISVVVQGPFLPAARDGDGTHAVLASVRAVLPGAELVLSSWKGLTDIVDCDVVVENDDPGPLPGPRSLNYLSNTGRQIVSTRSGLAHATRPFAIKLRSDTRLTTRAFVDEWDHRRTLGLRPWLLAEKVLISAYGTYEATRVPVPFNPADFFQLGRTEDLRRLWTIEAPTIADSEHFQTGTLRRWMNVSPGGELDRAERVCPEQYLFLRFLERAGEQFRQRGIRTVNPWKLLASERLIASHFVPINPLPSGVLLAEKFHERCKPGDLLFRGDCDGPLFNAASGAGAWRALVREVPALLQATSREAMGRARACVKHAIRRHLAI